MKMLFIIVDRLVYVKWNESISDFYIDELADITSLMIILVISTWLYFKHEISSFCVISKLVFNATDIF